MKSWLRSTIVLAVVIGSVMTTGTAFAGKSSAVVTGHIELASAALLSADGGGMTYGDQVAFASSVTGRLSSKARVYVQVVCSQGGKVVYQWSADQGFVFPLVQQDGLAALGLMFDASQPAECTGSLIYREDGGQTIIKTLDQVGFATVAA